MLITRAIVRHANCTYAPIPAAMRDAMGMVKGTQVVLDMPRPGEIRIRMLHDLLRTPEEIAAAQARKLIPTEDTTTP